MPANSNTTEASRGRLARAVAVGLGVLLLAAAGLKLYGLNVTPVPHFGWFSTPPVQVMAITWESALGLWLISGCSPWAATRVAIVTFAALAGVSLWLALTGVARCNCLGAIPANPWGVFFLDVCIVTLLLTNAKLDSAHPYPHSPTTVRSPLIDSFLVAAILLTASAAFGYLRYGSVHAAFLRLQGYDVTLDDAHVDFGAATVGQALERTVTIRNWSGDVIRVVGSQSNCSLVVRTDLPLEVPAGESRNISVTFRVPPATAGALTIKTAFWTDSAKAQLLPYTVGCRVLPHVEPASPIP